MTGFTGKKHTEETKKRIRASMKHRHGGKDNPYYDKKHSAENILNTTSSCHLKIHHQAYKYVVELGLVSDYLKWFDDRYGIEAAKLR